MALTYPGAQGDVTRLKRLRSREEAWRMLLMLLLLPAIIWGWIVWADVWLLPRWYVIGGFVGLVVPYMFWDNAKDALNAHVARMTARQAAAERAGAGDVKSDPVAPTPSLPVPPVINPFGPH